MNTLVDTETLTNAMELGRSQRRSATRLVDELENTRHLVCAAIMAFDSVEDLESRNGLVALLSLVENKLDHAVENIRDEFVDVVPDC